MTGKPKRETRAEYEARWKERGRVDRRNRRKPVDEDTLRAVGGEVAVRAYRKGYEEQRG